MKPTGIKLGKSFQLKGDKIAKRFVPRDASEAARWRKQPKTIKVARHQRRGT